MTDRERSSDEARLAERLRDLGAHLAYPLTPDIAATVRARLAARPERRARWWESLARSTPRRLALALLLLAVLTGALLALSPASRSAVAGWFGVPGLTFTYRTPTVPGTATRTTPSPAPGIATSAAPGTATPPAPSVVPGTATSPAPSTATRPATSQSVSVRLSLGQPLSLAEARARVAFPLLTPALPELGPPDEVYLAVPPIDGQVSLVWRARADFPPAAETGVGLLLTEFRGRLEPQYWQKTLGPNTRIEYPTVNGATGFWIAGGPHQFSYTDASGQIRWETTRLAGNVLLWEQGGVTFRLEGARTEAEALRVAATLR